MLLRRSPTEPQVGVEPSVVVPPAYDPLVRALAAGTRHAPLEATATGLGLPDEAVPDLLGPGRGPPAATAAGDHGSGRPRGRRGSPRGRTAHELLAAGFGTVYLADLPERPSRHGTAARHGLPPPASTRTPDPDRLDLLLATLAEAWPDARVRRTRHFVHPEGDAVALTVVVPDGPEPDRLVTDLLREAGAPHLLLRCRGDEAVVGPLVLPGTSSCVRWPTWPAATPTSAGPGCWSSSSGCRSAPPDPARVGGGHRRGAGAGVRRRRPGRDRRPDARAGDEQHTLRVRAWPPHADCPCRWAAAPPTRPGPG